MQVHSTDDVTVAVHDLGGAGAPFIICHATGFCGGAYIPLAERLAPHRHVWALDFRGHGDSTVPTGERFDWDGAADDLRAVIDALTPDEPVDVFGHSMGGAAAMLVERRRPGTLRSAYLFEPIILPDGVGPPPRENSLAVSARKRRATFPSKADALMRYASKTPLRALNAGALAAYVEHGFADDPEGTATLKLAPEHEAAVFDSTGKATLDTVRGLDVPTTIAIGVIEGEWSPAMFGQVIAEAMTNGRLLRFPTLGHFGPLEDPRGVAASIIESLAVLA